MQSIEIKRVSTKKELREFIDFHYDLYKGNAYDAPALFSSEWDTLNLECNSASDFCEAAYFMAYKDGKLAGRIAAIINNKANTQWNRKQVRFGWIDFIDDIEVSKALFDAVAEYGRSKGMNEMVGPLGFIDFDPEGMLIEGFDQLGTMATIYNYPYYPKHMEQMGGWAKDNDYVEFKLIVPDKVPEKYTKVANMVEKRYNLHVRTMTRKEINSGKGREIFQLVNATFKDLYGYSELTDKQIDGVLDIYLPFADLNLIPIVEDWNETPHKLVGVGITLPSLSEAMQHCRKGRLLPFGWWHVLKALKFHKTHIVDLEMIGILPEYRAKGANALLFAHLIPFYQKYGFEWGESQVEMETNESVQSQWGPLNPILHKRRRCYKKNI